MSNLLMKKISAIPDGIYRPFTEYAMNILSDFNYTHSNIKIIEKMDMITEYEFANCAEIEGRLLIIENTESRIRYFEFEDEEYTLIFDGTLDEYTRRYKSIIHTLF